MNDSTENQRIINWQFERNLIKTPQDVNLTKEISFIIEELIEMVTKRNSEQARDWAESIAQDIMMDADPNLTNEQVVDAACDIKVYATGLIRKMGYDPDIAMDETIKEIDTRTGSMQNGKYVKDKSPEAQAKWHKADYSKAEV